MPDSSDASGASIASYMQELLSPDPQTRINAILVLSRIGKGAVPALLDTLKQHHNPHARWYAAYVLGLIGDPDAVPALIEALDEGEFIANSARRALKHIATPEALRAIAQWNSARIFKRRR